MLHETEEYGPVLPQLSDRLALFRNYRITAFAPFISNCSILWNLEKDREFLF